MANYGARWVDDSTGGAARVRQPFAEKQMCAGPYPVSLNRLAFGVVRLVCHANRDNKLKYGVSIARPQHQEQRY